MVRLLKVKELDDRKQFLLAKSEMCRQTMKLQIANIKFAGVLAKKRFNFAFGAARTLGLVAPLAGFFLVQRRRRKAMQRKSGMISKVIGAIGLVNQLRPLFKGSQTTDGAERGLLARFFDR
jgi:hypothetical protein